jgi:hypothetical protein
MSVNGKAVLRDLLQTLDADELCAGVYKEAGVFILRKAIPAETMAIWQDEWGRFQQSTLSTRHVNQFNPVHVNEKLPPILNNIYKEGAILDNIEKIFGPNIGLFGHRFVIKDENSRGPVFLHHDSCYHIGFLNKLSAFVPLSTVTPENGGLTFFPGTHRLGYLGDAGEINPDILDSDWPTICPSLEPGDVVFMNSLTWHKSGPHIGGEDRIMADIIYQPADDPSCSEIVRGKWMTDMRLDRIPRNEFFRRSRTSRLVELEKRVKELEHSGQSA